MMPLPLRTSVRMPRLCGSDVCQVVPVRSGSAAPACPWALDDDETGASSQPVPEIRASSPPFLPLYPLQLLLHEVQHPHSPSAPPCRKSRVSFPSCCSPLLLRDVGMRARALTSYAACHDCHEQDKQRASQSRVHRRCQTISSKTLRPRSSSATMLPTRPRRSSMTCEEGGRAIRATLSVQN